MKTVFNFDLNLTNVFDSFDKKNIAKVITIYLKY